MKILYVITSLGIGGAEKIFYHTVRYFSKDNEAYVIVLKRNNYYGKLLQKDGIQVKSLYWPEKQSWISFVYLIYSIIYLICFILKYKINIVHSFLFSANVAARISAFISSVPVRISSIRVNEKSRYYVNKIDLITSKLSTDIVSVSRGLTEHLIKTGFNKQKIHTIPNGISFSEEHKMLAKSETYEFFNIPEDYFIIGSIGRLETQKNYKFLINTYINLIQPFFDKLNIKTKLLIIGYGSLENELKKICNKNIIIKTGINNAWKYIRIFDVFIISSHWEGLPNSLLESMLGKIPVVSADIPEMKDVIINQNTGLLYSPGNKKELMEKIKIYFEDTELRNRIIENAYKHIKNNYTLENNYKLTDELYKKYYENEK